MTTPLFSLSINAGSPEELDHALRALARAFGGFSNLANAVDVTGGTVQPLTGASSITMDVQTSHNIESPEPSKGEPEQGHPVPPVEDTKTPSVPADSTPVAAEDLAKLRAEAINKLTAWFGLNPGELGKLQQLQNKYGVKLFKDIPDDKVREFAADAHLTVSGAGEA